MSDKAKRILEAQLERLTGLPYPIYPPVVHQGTRAGLLRKAIREAGEEPHA